MSAIQLVILALLIANLLFGGVVNICADQAGSDSNPTKKYQWLFKDKQGPETPISSQSATDFPQLQRLDREIKAARKVYLAGDTDQGLAKYKETIDLFESILQDAPPGSLILAELDQRFVIYDELATKILGPVHLEPPPHAAPEIFNILERKRIARRNLVMKKAGPITFYDVAPELLQEETDRLNELGQIRSKVSVGKANQSEIALTDSLTTIRKSIEKSSKWAWQLRYGKPPDPAQFRNKILKSNEIALDFSILPDRLVMGVITQAGMKYNQVEINRPDLDQGVLLVQDKLKEAIIGDDASFMGHSWKEPLRRMHRILFGKFPVMPNGVNMVFVIPDRALWYLPLGLLPDSEDQPFGKNKTISMIPSADMLALVREHPRTIKDSVDLILLESLPWVASEDLKKSELEANKKRIGAYETEPEAVAKLILSSPTYPKPSQMVISAQKLFKNFDVLVGPTATPERFFNYHNKSGNVVIIAAPFSVTDFVSDESRPTFYFSPGKRSQRTVEVTKFFNMRLRSNLLMIPSAWFEVKNVDSVTGDGALLSSTAFLYSGNQSVLINYSDPTWGNDNPYLLNLMKRVGRGSGAGEALAAQPQELTVDTNPAFSGKPPQWAGWILMGNPNN